MLKLTRLDSGQLVGVESRNLPPLTLIENADDLKNFAGWHHWYNDEDITYPCWGFEIEHRCDSDYYFLTIDELEELLKLLRERASNA